MCYSASNCYGYRSGCCYPCGCCRRCCCGCGYGYGYGSSSRSGCGCGCGDSSGYGSSYASRSGCGCGSGCGSTDTTMTACVLEVRPDSLLVTDQCNNQQVQVNTTDACCYCAGDCLCIHYNGIMTASIPPQISATCICRL